jgi:hypothetical protein
MRQPSLAVANRIYRERAEEEARAKAKQATTLAPAKDLIAQVNARLRALALDLDEDDPEDKLKAKLQYGTVGTEYGPSKRDLILHFGSVAKWRRLARLASGHCSNCGEAPPQPGKTLCSRCRDINESRVNKYRTARAEASGTPWGRLEYAKTKKRKLGQSHD